MFNVSALSSFYGQSKVLHDLTFGAEKKEIVASWDGTAWASPR